MEIKEIVKTVKNALEDKKGEHISVINISGISTIADYFIIASGSNINQVQALADHVKEELFRLGMEAENVEGYQTGSWILLDYKDIVVHIFSKEDRVFYDLDRIWRDGKIETAI